MKRKYDILIDFDGTCTTHAFPGVGREIGAAPVLKELVAQGHRLILWTMRCDHKDDGKPLKASHGEILPIKGKYETEAVNWFKKHDIPLYSVGVNPGQEKWTKSRKAYGHYLIDDTAIGTPVIYDELTGREYINWMQLRLLLIQRGLLPA